MNCYPSSSKKILSAILEAGLLVPGTEEGFDAFIPRIVYGNIEKDFLTAIAHSSYTAHTSEEGKTPLMYAIENNDYPVELYKLLVTSPDDVNIQDEDGQTALHYMAKTDYPECIENLLELGADPFIRDNKGNNVLHTLAENKKMLSIDILGECVSLLPKKLLTMENNQGMTPITLFFQKLTGTEEEPYKRILFNQFLEQHLATPESLKGNILIGGSSNETRQKIHELVKEHVFRQLAERGIEYELIADKPPEETVSVLEKLADEGNENSTSWLHLVIIDELYDCQSPELGRQFEYAIHQLDGNTDVLIIAFDEFAGQAKKVDKALVDIMKNYMANKSFSRGIETMHAEASMVFVGNTKHTVPYMLKNSDLFEELPSAYHDSAFIDRIHAFVPGWEFDSIRFDMFSNGYGFIVDYLAEMLRYMRNRDYSNMYQDYFTLSSDITTRDKDGINKTFSGLMKLIYPNGEATKEEAKEILEFAIEQRKRVKDQLVRIDATFYDTEFSYLDNSSKEKSLVLAREEKEFPDLYKRKASETSPEEKREPEKQKDEDIQTIPDSLKSNARILGLLFPSPKAGNFSYEEDQSGVSYEKLFGEYLEGATRIEIQDPYIMKPYQTRNLMEFLEVVYHHKKPEDEVSVSLLTKADRDYFEDQDMRLSRIKDSAALIGIDFEYSYDGSDTIHDRNIVLNNSWKIILGRGLDIFQVFDSDMLSFASRVQEIRKCKAFEITYVRD